MILPTEKKKVGMDMKIEFYGATQCVTGSCHILRVKDKLILLDCGLFQGKNEKHHNNEHFPFNPEEIDYVILSHAHIDHSGRIPLLYKRGFTGQVLCTDATLDLCSIMLPDSGHIQEAEIEWKNRKRLRMGLDSLTPLYTVEDAERSMQLFEGYPYNQIIEVFDGLTLIFRNAGHLLGSAIVELFIKEEDKPIHLVYSGDLGNKNIPIVQNPTQIKSADYVIMETTYGDRLHSDGEKEMKQLVSIIKDTFKRGGNVIIPSFAVGRAQEVLYALNKFVENNELNNCKVYVDSPLASKATSIFKKYDDYYNEEAKLYLESGDDPLEFKGLIFTKSMQDSVELNKIQQGAVIISASGMCEAGRIKHHLKHNLWRKECAVVFVGYQAEGTLGRTILDGAKKVKIFGEEIAVKATIYNFQGLSGHADRNGLHEWITNFVQKPKKIFLVHGEDESKSEFKNLLDTEYLNSQIVSLGQVIELDHVTREKPTKKDKLLTLINDVDIETVSKEELLALIEKVL